MVSSGFARFAPARKAAAAAYSLAAPLTVTSGGLPILLENQGV
jgi:hypothetical protein